MSKRDRINKFVLWLLLSALFVLLFIESLSLTRWILYPFCPSISYEDSSWWPVHLETKLFYLPVGLAPLVFIVTIFAWIIIPFRRYLGAFKVRVRIGERAIALLGRPKIRFERQAKTETFGLNLSVLALACSIGLASLFAIYPYLPSLNPDGRHVGIDFPHYNEWLFEMDEGDWLKAGEYAFFTLRDRSLSVLLIFGAHRMTGLSLQTTLKFLPLLLGPSLILAIFYFMLETTRDWTVSSLAALLAAFSYPVTVGMLGTLFSNWMGLIEVYLFSGLMIRSLRDRSWLWVFLTASMLASLLFTHASTWAMLIGVLGLYAVLQVILGLRGEDVWWDLKAVGAIAVSNVVVDLIRNWFLGSIGVAKEASSVARSGLSLEFLAEFWSNLDWTFHNTMGGFFMNPLVILLAFIGAFFICLKDKPLHRYLASWLIVSSVPFILASYEVQWRILYVLPITIYAVFGLDYLRTRIRMQGSREGRILEYLLILLVVLINANYGLRCAHHLLEAFVFE